MENQFIFTRPLTYELKDNGDLIINLDISTTEPDLVNDIVTLNFLKSMQKQILDQNKKLDIEHESFRGKSVEEKEINKTKIPAGRMLEPTIVEYQNEKKETHHSLNIKGIINKFRSDYENIKGNIMDKFLDAGSIAFIPTKFRKEQKGEKVFRYLEDGILLNTALTGNPINTTAQMRGIISKSIDSLEEYQKSKESNPDIENRLEVKSAASDKKKEEAAGDKEENMTDDEKKKKKMMEEEEMKKGQDHNHISDILIKSQEVKNMGEDKPAENVDVKADVKVEASLEMKAQIDSLTKENAEQKSEMEKLKSKIAEMDAVLSQSVKKSKPETKAKDFAEKKSYPLDIIA